MEEYSVYSYHFIDDLRFIRPAKKVLVEDGLILEIVNKKINSIKKLFKKNGWEGDGEIGIIWLPPFLDDRNFIGQYLWHVKQGNNGTSFIACPNDASIGILRDSKDHVDIAKCIKEDTEEFVRYLECMTNQLNDEIGCINNISELNVRDGIKKKVLIATHDDLVAKLQRQMDQYYLDLLQERYINHNPRVKLEEIKKINFKEYQNESEFYGEKKHEKMFRINLNLISAIWNSYVSSGFNEKFIYLMKSVRFSYDKNKINLIKTHVILRNAIHHNDGILSLKFLKQLKGSKAVISDEVKLSSGIILKGGGEIIFSEVDLLFLTNILSDFAKKFNDYLSDDVIWVS